MTKTKKRTDSSGAVTSTTLVDPWGGEVTGVWALNPTQQRRKFTSYERDANDRDEAQQRSYSAWFSRFDQADPSDSSYDLTDPQSLNRYSYVQGDPVNFVDPSGLLKTAPGRGGRTCEGYDVWRMWFRDGEYIGKRYLGFVPTWCSSPGGDEGGVGGPGPQDARRSTKKLETALDSCLRSLFGVSLTSLRPSEKGKNGNVNMNFTDPSRRLNGFTGFGVLNDVTTYSRSAARAYVNSVYVANGQPPIPSNGVIYGFTKSSSPHINFTVNDERNPAKILRTQIHELGHSLENILGITEYEEAGWVLENCVAKLGGFKRS